MKTTAYHELGVLPTDASHGDDDDPHFRAGASDPVLDSSGRATLFMVGGTTGFCVLGLLLVVWMHQLAAGHPPAPPAAPSWHGGQAEAYVKSTHQSLRFPLRTARATGRAMRVERRRVGPA